MEELGDVVQDFSVIEERLSDVVLCFEDVQALIFLACVLILVQIGVLLACIVSNVFRG